MRAINYKNLLQTSRNVNHYNLQTNENLVPLCSNALI